MHTYDFIFANRPRFRISRHVLFWLCWFAFVILALRIPAGDIFPNWDIKARNDFAFKKYGVDFVTLRGGLANFIWEISYKELRLLLCHMLFTYAIIYYILPHYTSRGKKWIRTTTELLLICIVFLGLHYFVTYRNFVDSANDWIRRGAQLPSGSPIVVANFSAVLRTVVRVILFNATTVVGLAVAIKLLKRWWLKQKETEQVAKEKLNAELQLLKAQVHPHFLFNSLNNIYSFALEGSQKAPEMIQKLSGLLHYMLYGCKEPMVPLEKELKMIEDYISLEKIRYGERLKMEMDVQKAGNEQMIAPLLLIPFVENSFKHGTSKMLSRPEIMLHISILENILHFKLTNSRPYGIDETSLNTNRGLGLRNVKKRLALLYPYQHELQIIDDESSYTVWLKVVLTHQVLAGIKETVTIKKVADYELA